MLKINRSFFLAMIAGSYADALYDSEKIIFKQSNTTSFSPFFGPDCLLTEDVDQYRNGHVLVVCCFAKATNKVATVSN